MMELKMLLPFIYFASMFVCFITLAVTLAEADKQVNKLISDRVFYGPYYIIPSEFLIVIAGFSVFPIINTFIALLLIFHFIQKPKDKFYY